MISIRVHDVHMMCTLVTGCNCSSVGAESNACDIRTGQCRCRPHVTGRACDTCEEGYWGLEQGGCRRCECGAGASACDPVTGLCACAVGVGGPRCDRCLPGYYGYGPTGCLPCPTCTDGRVCSPITGRCVCPTRTRGPGCQHCARGFWGRAAGCRPCACGPGALADSCDAISGKCECRAGWTGRECSRCTAGHFGPRCRPCGCNIAGTRGCEQGLCACDQTGQCPCKENVVGEKCDECLDGTFGLSETNPVGCTACFCFGRSAKCTQAEVTRAALHAATPLHLKVLRGDMVNTATMDIDSPFAVRTSLQEATIPLPWPPAPVYAELSELFLGDHVLSYGGALRFQVEEEGGEALPQHVLMRFPLVSIYGNNIILDYYERMPAVNGSHAVYLHESLWEVRPRAGDRVRTRGPIVASRSALMLGLIDVQRLLLRLSTRAPLTMEPLHVLLLNVSLETAIAGLTRGAPAPGVERCLCPRGYDAASCHRPATGFWMPPSPPQLHHIGGTIVINVEGTAKPCECNNRAIECHPRTGHCLNCTHNTGGPKCERCAEGYYGSPELGCEPCPCPARDRPRATSCAVAHGRLRCYCKIGYTGPTCESCASGFRPQGDQCVPCECDTRGAVSLRCDAQARCHCRSFATGDKCQTCAMRRHYLDEDGCKPCDNCTQTLLDTVESLTSDLHLRVDPTELSRIPQPFPALREFAHNASVLKISLQHEKRKLENSKHLETSVGKLEASEHELFTIANRVKTEAARRENEAHSLSLESMSGLEEVLKHRGIIGEQVAVLDDFARGEKHLSAHRALKEARHLLKSIKELSLIGAIARATDISDLANMQSTSIQEFNYRIDDELKRIHQLESSLGEWEMKAEDIPRLAETVWNAGDVVVELKRRVLPKLAAVKDVGLRCRLALEDISKLAIQNLTDETRSGLLHTQNLAVGFPAILAELQNLTAAAEEKEGILYNLTPKYKEKYLDTVLKHVAVLGEKAKEYKNLFAGTRAVASAGVQAARAWAEVAERVRDAAAAADAATAAADLAAKLSRGPQPLLATADEEKSTSEMLKRRGTEVLSKADVSQIRGNALRGTEVAEALAAAAAARAKEHQTAAASLNPALQALREQIQRAKHAASSISVSVTSPGDAGVGCARAYSAWTGPAATRAILALSFETVVHDGTLLYLPDQEDSERFMRLVVENGRLKLRWNVGGGEGVVEHPEILQPTLDDADHTTYRLHIERVWGTVKLRVERVGQPVITSSNSTVVTPGSGLLRPALWWLGETGAPLPACVHSLHADHGAIGLWAFAKQPPTAKCIGCTQRWYSNSRGTEGMVWLGGSGYVALRRSRRPSDRRRFSLALTFRTTDTDALLFLAHDKANYSESRLEITAGGRHCDGRPAHLQATRVFNGLERGSLRVNGEETLGSPSPPVQSAASLPELSSSTYWVGGLPPEGEGLGYESLPLLGCVGGIMVDREGYDLMDTSTRHGVESGCAARPLRSAVSEGSGFIELASPVIRRKTSVGISFLARSPSGLLLYRAPTIAVDDNEVEEEDGDDHHYLVLALVNGELELTANAGKGELRLQLNGTKLDDGVLHTVRLVRAHKQVEVWVDEKRLGSGALAGGAFAARNRGLYLGGVPPTHSSGLQLPAQAFTGTLADLIVDSTWIGLETSVRRAGVRLARADGELRDARNEPRALHAQPDADTSCAKILRVGGFVGCIRRVTINGRAEDLVRDSRAHTSVGQCFPHIERGAYFAEGASELAEGRESFKGCIRDVIVGGSARDWKHARAIHNVLLDSCPVAQ
ncbi:jg14057 [Pararge aegeria aegeria]|uniref:Jg14057 protein n=1 Tax=Pararge aegeria aegeria TaxID=348720 RepID=A0A8S4SLC2_9NEOP|nr:jg14057 [Pararge aegeria aegeria]